MKKLAMGIMAAALAGCIFTGAALAEEAELLPGGGSLLPALGDFAAQLDLVDLLVQLPVDIEDRVCRVEVYLDRGLGGVNGEGALDGHNDDNVVCRVDPPPDDKAVEPRQHGDQPDIGRDHKVQDADALVALHTQPPQPTVDVADLHALFIEIGRVVAGGHDIGDKS